MKLTGRIYLTILSILSCTSCIKKESDLQPGDLSCEKTPLNISVNMAGIQSKTLITGTMLYDGSTIGISLTNDNGSPYDGLPYSNVRFVAEGDGNAQKWIPDTDVMLSASKASLRAYYPFDDEVEDLASIPVEASDAVQTDYLYAAPVTGLFNHNPDASITMKHALAAIRISLKRGTYTGTGEVSSIAVKGEGLATSASLDAGSGSLSSFSGTGTPISPEIESFTLSDSYSSNDIIVIPASTGKPMEIEVIIDGEKFSATIPEAGVGQGKISVYEAVVNNSEISLSDIMIDEWKYDSGGNPTLEHSWTIRIIGDTEGISFANSIEEDGSIKIVAVPMLNDAEVMSPAITGSTDYTETVDNETGIRTITLKNIESDIDIKYDGYNLWVTATYIISDTSTSRLLLGKNSNCEKNCQKIIVDGKEIEITETYQFESTGEHTARIMFKRNTSESVIPYYGKYNIPMGIFSNNRILSEIKIPKGMTHINPQAFKGCKLLDKVEIPSTITVIGYQSLQGCSSITSLSFPPDSRISYSAMASCSSLTTVKLPANATSIASGIFYGCHSLETVEIPSGVVTIDYNAFQSSGLKELYIPDGVKVIPDGLCQYCTKLKQVRLPAGLTSIGRSAFASCTELDTFIHSDGTSWTGEINIPEGVREVKATAFYASEKFTSLKLPSTLISIEEGAFASNNISSVSISEDNKVFDVRCNAIIETAVNSLKHGFKTSTIDNSVTSIGAYAFYQVEIPVIDLHKDIISIGDHAFYSCSSSKVISRAVNPPELNTKSFSILTSRGVLKVPAEALEAYQNEWFKDEEGYLGYNGINWSLTALNDGE